MSAGNSSGRKAQLDKAEREQLEEVVVDLRETVEEEIEYELEHLYGLTEREGGESLSNEEQHTRERLVEAIDHENPGERSWEWCYEQYVNGVGYTLINRITALRCMEVRGFIDQPVTQIGESDLTPAAEQVAIENPLLDSRDEALVVAYEEECERLSDEVELLFDTDSPYDVIDPEPDTFRDSIAMLDDIPDEVWRADDVLGWVYEYYNVALLDDLRRKGDRDGLEPEDVPPANQFYTPHWVVRMLTDNSLGKLYLEDTGELSDAVEAQDSLTPDERKNRPLSPDESSNISDFCTYLVPSEEEGEPPEFDGPEDIRVIDPACGSGHFLLYAFDVLERIYRVETDLDHAEIPREILRNNLYGVDLDMRACQLAAFNLYLKGRTRAEAEGANGFDMSEVGIVCADAKVADVEGVEEVFDEVADGKSDVEEALRRILDAFEEVHGLGSLLDVRGTLGDLFEDDSEQDGVQITLEDDPREHYTLGQLLHSLREAVDQHRGEDSFLAQDLRSFVRLLDVLVQDYDVALMNPPYGSKNRMPDSVEDYVKEHYTYSPEFYINFFEVCDRLTRDNGRIGMLVSRSFMYKQRWEDFRKDFIGSKGSFDFLAEFGLGILDNATVRTAGTVVRSSASQSPSGTFLRLYDMAAGKKEPSFTKTISGEVGDIQRIFEVKLEEFGNIPRSPICYAVPQLIRDFHDTNLRVDSEQAGVDGDSVCFAVPGLQTSDDDRFTRYLWEVDDYTQFKPIAKGGSDAWILPRISETVDWEDNGRILKRSSKSLRIRNEDLYGREGVAWTRIKETGRRFGYYSGGMFSDTGNMVIPRGDISVWTLMSTLNSSLYHGLFLSQTTERHLNAGEVGSVPWLEQIESIDELETIAKKQHQLMLHERRKSPTSPYYAGPEILPKKRREQFYHEHPHPRSVEIAEGDLESQQAEFSDNIQRVARKSEQATLQRQRKLESLSQQIDDLIYDELDIRPDIRNQIQTEIYLRTSEDPEDREVPDPESVPEVPDNLDEQVKDLVHHFAMEAVREESDGIIPLEGTDKQADMLDRIVERFEDAYGEYAEDRLVEVDDILGDESAADEAYPNLRSFIEDDLFAYHVDTMENTPIIWKLSTERLLADAKSEGFACFVDYHQLDTGIFDRLSTRYIEPTAEQLREHRSAADRRRSDDTLSSEERAEAREEFEQYASALQQIANFNDALQELGSMSQRALDDETRDRCEELAPKVAAFRKETAQRIEAMAKLREEKGKKWFKDTFSDKFWENKIEEWGDEWIDALEELERACDAYSTPTDEPIEAHLADLFEYFDWRLKGTDSFQSTGILSMTYYFEKAGAHLLNDNGEPHETLSDDEQLLASLAMGLEDDSVLDRDYIDEVWEPDEDAPDDAEAPPLAEYKALAEEINDDCNAISEEIPDEWSERALSEITTAGYRPNHKHGVAINITPFAEKNIVPEIVEDKVL